MDEEKRTERVRQRARQLWIDAGRPAAGEAAFAEEAKQLVAIEEAPHAGTIPLEESMDTPAEPIEAVENQGEFPTLTDQGEDNPVPLTREARRTDRV